MDPLALTAEEWYAVLEGPSAAASLVMASDMSGLLGLTNETKAAFAVLQKTAFQTPFMQAFRSEVLEASRERQQEFQTIAKERQRQALAQKPTKEDLLQMQADAVANGVALVESKGGAEAADEYRRAIFAMAQEAAEAGKEGGFLGFGGQLVSDAEQSALERIRKLLGL